MMELRAVRGARWGRIRFGLRALFVLLLFAGIGLGWLCRMSPHWHAVAELRSLGMDVEVAHPAESTASRAIRSCFSGTVNRVSPGVTFTYRSNDSYDRAGKALGQLCGLESFEGRLLASKLPKAVAHGLVKQTRLQRLEIDCSVLTDATGFLGSFSDLRTLVVYDVRPFSRVPLPATTVPTVTFDCGSLSGNRQLESLELDNLLAVNVDRLADLPLLTRLWLSHVKQDDLKFAAQIPALTDFLLSSSSDSFDPSAIASLRTVERFGFGGNSLQSLALFRDLPKLRRLSLLGPARDLSELARLDSLEELSLGGADGYQCAAGEMPKNLVQLRLKPETGSVDAGMLSGLNRLRILSLRNVVGLEALAGLTALEELELEETTLESAGPFTRLPMLQRIRLHQCRIPPPVLAELQRVCPEVDLTLNDCRTPDGTRIRE